MQSLLQIFLPGEKMDKLNMLEILSTPMQDEICYQCERLTLANHVLFPTNQLKTLSNSFEVISNSLTKGALTNGMPNTSTTTFGVTLTTIPKRVYLR